MGILTLTGIPGDARPLLYPEREKPDYSLVTKQKQQPKAVKTSAGDLKNNQIVQIVTIPSESSKKESSEEGFDEFKLSDFMSWLAISTDVNATIRNGFSMLVPLIKGGASIVAMVGMATVLQGMQCIQLVAFAAKSIPDTYREVTKAMKSTSLHRDQLLKDAVLKFANQVLLLVIALTFGALAVVGGITLAGILAGAVVAASAALELVLGAVCIARGLVITGKCIHVFHHMRKFEKEFRVGLESGSTGVFTVLNNEMKKDNLNSRVIKAALETLFNEEYKKITDKREELDQIRKASAGLKDNNMLIGKDLSDALKTKILEVVDRSIFEEKLKQAWMGMIGVLMSIGGGLSIAASCSGVGMPASIISSAACGAFLAMEAGWIPVDSSRVFRWLVDKTYSADPRIEVLFGSQVVQSQGAAA